MIVRRIIILGVVLFAVTSVTAWVFFPDQVRDVMRGGKVRVETWVAGQIHRIADRYLAAELEFESFEFEDIDTIVLNDAVLRDGDVDFVSCGRIRVTFGEIPKYGEPIVISGIELERPAVRLIVADDKKLVGWSNLLAEDDEETPPDENAVSTELADVFDIRKIAIVNGFIEYRVVSSPDSMVFDGLSLDLDVQPEEAGWFAIDGGISEGALAQFALDGRINLDSAVVEVTEAEFDVELAEDGYGVLPPQVQSMLKEHDVRGALSLIASGSVPLRDLASASLKGTTTLTEGSATVDEYTFPIDEVSGRYTLTGTKLSVPQLAAQALDGNWELKINADFADIGAITIAYVVQDVMLRSILKDGESANPKMAGLVNIRGVASSSLRDVMESLSVAGEFDIRKGKLVQLPVVSQLVSVVGKVIPQSAFEDTASAKFEVVNEEPRTVQVSKLSLVSSGIAASGGGTITFDGGLNLSVNAGPLKNVQNQLGFIGDALGQITDRLLKYGVTGTIENPKVTPKPLGIGNP